MFGAGWTEMLIIGIVALVVIGPKDLPVVMRKIGRVVGTVRRMGGEFQRELNKTTGLDQIADLRRSITEPLRQTSEEIAKEFNRQTATGVEPTGIVKPLDPEVESVYEQITAASGLPTTEMAAAPAPAIATAEPLPAPVEAAPAPAPVQPVAPVPPTSPTKAARAKSTAKPKAAPKRAAAETPAATVKATRPARRKPAQVAAVGKAEMMPTLSAPASAAAPTVAATGGRPRGAKATPKPADTGTAPRPAASRARAKKA